MILTIGQLIVIPLIIGFLMNEYMPKITSKLRKPIKNISFIIFIGFVVGAIAGNLENLKNYIGIVFFYSADAQFVGIVYRLFVGQIFDKTSCGRCANHLHRDRHSNLGSGAHPYF